MKHALLIAFQFLTILPVKTPTYTNDSIGQSLIFYPWVGLVIGSALYLLSTVFSPLLSPLVTAVIVLSCWVLLTGALHLDGLADSADAWLGGLGSQTKTLEIMKDPRAGPVAVVVLVLVLLLKVVFIYELLRSNHIALVVWPAVVARCGTILLFLTTVYCKEEGIAKNIQDNLSSFGASVSLLFVIVLGFAFAGLHFFAMLIFCGFVFFLLRYLILKRLAGFTGDTAGALLEFTEVAALFSLVLSVAWG